MEHQHVHKRETFGIEQHGITNSGNVYRNLSTPALYEEVVRRREGFISHLGPVVVRTGQHTGRAAKDKFVVKEPSNQDKIWWGKVNIPFDERKFELLHQRMCAYLQGRDIYIQDCHAGADANYRIPVRIITETAWHNMFARNMFIRILDKKDLAQHRPDFVVINVPSFMANPEIDGTVSPTFILVHFSRRLILIGGTSYAGEIKKSIFTIMNYLLPQKDVLSMHCSANIGKSGDVAIFFGLSGTGKTTLSADPERMLIGDDEHGWSENGVFNFEGGCYAKVIKLSKDAEPEIYETTRRFGTILENVALDFDTRRINLDDDSLTENTRAAYPISHIPNIVRDGMGGQPSNIIFLTADAFGVMPPVSKLTQEQAIYHFLSGYTAKLAGTEKGVTEPSATFSACFGAPFMSLNPAVYARLLGEKIETHKVNCWLVNTGWTGGPYGIGNRMPIRDTRAMVRAALDGTLAKIETKRDDIFGLHIPVSCPNVAPEVLIPENTWQDKAAYREKAKELAANFQKNFKQFDKDVSEEVKKIAIQA
jgi:phosphoenolpyruvate carboxykinase (ATP)